MHFSRLNCLRTGEYLLERSWVLQAWLHPGLSTGSLVSNWSQSLPLESAEGCPGSTKALHGAHLRCLFAVPKHHILSLFSTLDSPYAFQNYYFLQKISKEYTTPLFKFLFTIFFHRKGIIPISNLHLTLSYFFCELFHL